MLIGLHSKANFLVEWYTWLGMRATGCCDHDRLNASVFVPLLEKTVLE
jgi:hypothetical protein